MKNKNKLLFFLIIFTSLFISCELVYDQTPGRIVLIGVGLDYDGTIRSLDNPPNDIREISYAFSHLAKQSNNEFIYIPMIQQKGIGVIPDFNYPNSGNLEKLFNDIEANSIIRANVYNGEFDETYSLISSYDTFGVRFDNFTLDLKKGDIVVFYYSGHGDENDQGALRVPIEKDTTDRTSIALSTITNWVSSLNSKSLIVLDSCGSGALVPESDVTVNTATTTFNDTFPTLRNNFYSYNDGESGNNDLFLMASTLDKKLSWDTSQVSNAAHLNSNFSYYFLKSLGYENNSDMEIGNMNNRIPSKKNGLITIDSIYEFIDGRIKRQQPLVVGERKNLVLFSNL